MKKILFAMAILPLLVFISCSSDDDNPSNSNFDHNIELLYGQWRATGVEVSGVTIDLTEKRNELMVAPTFVTFGVGGSYLSEGILGEGKGKYTTKDKTIYTTVGKNKVNFEMTSLNAKTAKIILDAKKLGLSIIPEGVETVVVVLTKDYPSANDFAHSLTMLYGEWRATSIEGVFPKPIDLTDPVISQSIKPTFVTFMEKGVYSSKGILGEGTGRYATEGVSIYTLVGEKVLDYEMTSLEAKTARIELNAKDIKFGIEIPAETNIVTVVLTKQDKK